MNNKIQNLLQYVEGMQQKQNGSMLYKKYIDEIKTITPQELMYIQNEQLKKGLSPAEVLVSVDKLMNVFHESLSKHKLSEPIDHEFIKYLVAENNALDAILNDFKEVIKSEPLIGNHKLRTFLDKVIEYNDHLLKLENILFAYLEKKDERYNGLQILWALHNNTRNMIKNLESAFKNNEDETALKLEISHLYFNLFGLIQKQELILFPCAVDLIPKKQFEDMHLQSFDYNFANITKPKKPQHNSSKTQEVAGMFSCDTGQIKLDDLPFVMNALPFDMTFVDANDEVAYFSNPKKRFFPRSKAAIGRNVRNCHPPKSVHIVEKILASFKDGTRDEASFWITINGEMVLIKYIAVRNDLGDYKGTVEIVQEIDDIRALEGEKDCWIGNDALSTHKKII